MVPQRGTGSSDPRARPGPRPLAARLARRWIVKDLAQLNYSASGVSASDRLRFLTAYLGHRPSNDPRARSPSCESPALSPGTRKKTASDQPRGLARHSTLSVPSSA